MSRIQYNHDVPPQASVPTCDTVAHAARMKPKYRAKAKQYWQLPPPVHPPHWPQHWIPPHPNHPLQFQDMWLDPVFQNHLAIQNALVGAYAMSDPNWCTPDYSPQQVIARQVIGPPPGVEEVNEVEEVEESDASGRSSKSTDTDSSSVAASPVEPEDAVAKAASRHFRAQLIAILRSLYNNNMEVS